MDLQRNLIRDSTGFGIRFDLVIFLAIMLSFVWVGVVFNDFAYKINLHSFGHQKHLIQFRLSFNTSETISLKRGITSHSKTHST